MMKKLMIGAAVSALMVVGSIGASARAPVEFHA